MLFDCQASQGSSGKWCQSPVFQPTRPQIFYGPGRQRFHRGGRRGTQRQLVRPVRQVRPVRL